MEVERFLVELWTMASPAFSLAEEIVSNTARTEPLLAFLCGVAAVLLRARLLIIGAIVLAASHGAVFFEFLPAEPVWLLPTAAAVLIVGLIQGVAVTVLGDDGGNDLMVFLLVGILAVVAFLIWRGPKGLLVRLVRGRA